MVGNVIAKILLVLFLLAAPFLLIGFGSEVWKTLSNLSIRSPKVFAFLIGGALFFPVWWLARRFFQTPWHYLTTLEHECTHAIVGLLFGKIPVSMRVSAWEGGEVHLRGGSNLWISLAPYFVPTLSFLVIIIGLIFGVSNSIYFFGVLGWTIAFHLLTNWQETSFRQPDLQKAGYLTSILVLPIANLLTYGAIFSFVFGNAQSFFSFWLDGGKSSWLAFQQIFRL
jgi:hypothetical protein